VTPVLTRPVPTRATAERSALPAWPRNLPPVILLGGAANALSVARQVGRLGAQVYALPEPPGLVVHSRYCRGLRPGGTWEQFLLGPESDFLRGAVLLACGDAGIQLIAARREQLAERFRLDDSNPAAQRQMLDKLSTYRAAAAAGVPTPKFWVAESRQQLEAVRGELVFPLVVKPRLSHVFENKTGKKLLVVNDYNGVAAAVDEIAATGTDCLLMELIPGPDDRLCSYFTYLDEDSRPMFHFTKRVIRRYPLMTGGACYHVTDRIPELPELANRLFRHVGLRGLANVEFKRDARDGRYKVIECNARFVASDCLVARSGINLAAFVYSRITGRELPKMDTYALGMRLWDPVRDFQAQAALRRRGELTLWQGLASVCHRQTFQYFQWTDPLPALARLTLPLRRWGRREKIEDRR
jgi:predicted ATP-grasp superfamily ATP-dependent carboligase